MCPFVQRVNFYSYLERQRSFAKHIMHGTWLNGSCNNHSDITCTLQKLGKEEMR